MKKILLLFALVLFSIMTSYSQCSGSISLQSQNGNTYVFTTIVSQAYFWSVTGNASISGSNTQQNVTIVATGDLSFDVSVVRFSNGICCPSTYEVCPLHIEEDPLNMCISSSTPNFKKRGLFFLYDCNGDPVNADWVILEGNQYFQFVIGPNNTPYINIKPNTTSIIGNITVQAFAPNTNTLLASFVTEVYDCDICSTCKMASPDGSGGISIDRHQLIFSSELAQIVSMEVIELSSGRTVYSDRKFNVSKGNNFFPLEKLRLKQDKKVYVVRIITQSKEVVSEKFVL